MARPATLRTVLAVAVAAAVLPSPLAKEHAAALSLVASVVQGACSGTKTSTEQCYKWVCLGDTWELMSKPRGTACNDGNPCTYNDACDGVNCSGTVGCIPSGPCEVCNGTASCAKAAAGTPCPSSPDGNPCEAVCDGSSVSCQPQ